MPAANRKKKDACTLTWLNLEKCIQSHENLMEILSLYLFCGFQVAGFPWPGRGSRVGHGVVIVNKVTHQAQLISSDLGPFKPRDRLSVVRH